MSSASQGTMGMPSGVHRRTASPAHATELLLLASESGPHSPPTCPPSFLPPPLPSMWRDYCEILVQSPRFLNGDSVPTLAPENRMRAWETLV